MRACSVVLHCSAQGPATAQHRNDQGSAPGDQCIRGVRCRACPAVASQLQPVFRLGGYTETSQARCLQLHALAMHETRCWHHHAGLLAGGRTLTQRHWWTRCMQGTSARPWMSPTPSPCQRCPWSARPSRLPAQTSNTQRLGATRSHLYMYALPKRGYGGDVFALLC